MIYQLSKLLQFLANGWSKGWLILIAVRVKCHLAVLYSILFYITKQLVRTRSVKNQIFYLLTSVLHGKYCLFYTSPQRTPPKFSYGMGWRRRRHRHRNSAPKTIQLAAIPCPGSNSCPFKMKSSAWPGKIWAKKCENIYNTTNHKVLVIFTTKRLQKKSVILLFHIKIKEFHVFFSKF